MMSPSTLNEGIRNIPPFVHASVTSEHRIAFLHIMKTGGKTLGGVLAQFYTLLHFYGHPSFRGPVKSNANCVWGHFCYDDIPADSGRTMITLLRHPAQRVMSMYEMTRRNNTDTVVAQLPDVWRDSEFISIGEFARLQSADNHMTRQLCGWDAFRVGEVSEKELDTAIEHLSIMLFGFTESLHEFVEIMCTRFGWNVPSYHIRNVSPAYATDASTLAELEQINWADMRLYEWALEHQKQTI